MATLASEWPRHLRLLLCNRWAEFNKAWQEARSESPVGSTKFVFFGPIEDNNIATLTSDWLLCNYWIEINEIWQEWTSKHPLPSLWALFSSWSENQDDLWLAETFSASSLQRLKGIQGNLTWSKISIISTKFVIFGPIGKLRWPPSSQIGWGIFVFFSSTSEQNSKKQFQAIKEKPLSW